MTSKPDSPGRDWGPPLALAGLGVVVVAVIAGFIAVGGPGDARDRRLDDMTVTRLNTLAIKARCALSLTGSLPQDEAELRAALEKAAPSRPQNPSCAYYEPEPGALPGIEYARIDATHVRLCGTFRRAFNPESGDPRGRPPGPAYEDFPALNKAHPAGRHCFEVEVFPLQAQGLFKFQNPPPISPEPPPAN